MKQPLTVFKDARGRYRWVTLSSSAYRNRDGEIVSTKALEDDVARADADGQYGPLCWWHEPLIELGTADFNAMIGRILVESGTFLSEAIGATFAAHADELEVSIAFEHPDDEPSADGVYHTIRRFERSLLPRGEAANDMTGLMVRTAMKGQGTMDQAKIAALKAIGFTDADIADIVQRARAKDALAVAEKVDFKSTKVRYKDAPTFPPGTVIDDLTVAEFKQLWQPAYDQLWSALQQLSAAAARRYGIADPLATTKAFGPKTTPADPVDADLEVVRQAVVAASQKIGDTQIGKELQAFAQRLQQLAGIQAPTAAGMLRDDQAPMPTTKAAESPHLFDPVPAQKGGDLAAIFGKAYGHDHTNGRN